MVRQRKRNVGGGQARRVRINNSQAKRKVRIEGDWAVRRGACGVVRKGKEHKGWLVRKYEGSQAEGRRR